MNPGETPSSGAAEGAAAQAEPDLADRREGDRALRFWSGRQKEQDRAGVSLDIALPDSWAHCFVLLPKPAIEASVLLAYGRDFARAFGLPLEAVPPVPIAGRLPRRVRELLLRGCADAQQQNSSVRSEGEIELADGRHELYRAVFIPVREHQRELRVFGSFNSRPADPDAQLQAAASRQPPSGSFWQRLKSRLLPAR